MWFTNFQLTDDKGNIKAGRLAAWVLLCLAACVSALFTLYVNANNDKLEKVLQVKDQQVEWMSKQGAEKDTAVLTLMRLLDSCRSAPP